MDQILNQILNELKLLKEGQQEFREELLGFKGELRGFKEDQQGFKRELLGFKEDQQGFKGELLGIKGELRGIKEEISELKEGQLRIEKKLDAVYDHTAKITEDITETNMNLKKLSTGVNYIKYKEHQTEEDLFELKETLHIVK